MEGLPSGRALLSHYRIDQHFSNAYTLWKKMGSPQNPTAEQVAALQKAGQLQLYTSPEWIKIEQGKAVVKMELPRQGISLVELSVVN